jgi:hypothetical protein
MTRERTIWLLLCVLAGGWLLVRACTTGVGVGYVEAIDGASVPASYTQAQLGFAETSWSRTAGIWTAAFMTVAVMSFLYKDNVFYKLSEAVFIGVSAAYWMVVAFWTVLVPNLIGKIFPATVQSWAMPGLSPVRDEHWWINIIPLVLGVMLLWRLVPKGGWISKWPLAFVIGTTAGLKLVSFLQADFLSQIRASIKPLIVTGADGAIQWGQSFSNSLLLVSVLAALTYFFFSWEHKGALGKASRVGVWVLMITFGAAFANTVMARIALLGIRFEFLFDDWLWLVDLEKQRLGM